MWKYAREIKVRDPGKELGHRHRQNAEARAHGEWTIRTNARGFRSPEITERAEPGVARIAFVGNSITLGWGVAEHETFARTDRRRPGQSGRKVEAFNLGVGNYNTSQELTLFRDVGAGPGPTSSSSATSSTMPSRCRSTRPLATGLSEHSAAWVVFRLQINSLLRKFGESSRLEALLSGALPARCAPAGPRPGMPSPASPQQARDLGAELARLQYSRAARIEALSVRRRHGTRSARSSKAKRVPFSTSCQRSRTSNRRAWGDRARSAPQRTGRVGLRPPA